MIHLLSADHRTHGLDVVARLGATSAHLGTDLCEAVPGIDGVVIIGTCNRLALLLDTPASPVALASGVGSFLAQRAGLPSLELQAWHGPDAIAELFATAAGLASMVVGEREIAGQIRRAMILAHDDGTLTGPLARAIEHASSASRLVARETELAGTGRSVVAVGLDLAARLLPPLDAARVLLVGTGAYAGASVLALRERGVRDLEVYSRSDRGAAFAAGHDLRAVTEAELPASLAMADLVVTCRGLGAPVLTRALVEPATRLRLASPALLAHHESPGDQATRSERPLVILDLALTRDVEEAVGSLPGVTLIDLPAVQRAVPAAEAAHVARAREIVAAEAQAYCRLAGGRRMDPLISNLRAHVDDLVAREAARLHVTDGKVDADEAERALHRLAARLLHHPSVAARQAGESGREEEYLAALPMLVGADVTASLLAGHGAPATCPVHAALAAGRLKEDS